MFIPPISPQSPSPIIRDWYSRPVVGAVPKVPPHKLKQKDVCIQDVTILRVREEEVQSMAEM
jgi:hypothetical protein